MISPADGADLSDTASARSLAFFDEAHRAFTLALERAGPVERHFAVGGRCVRLLFAGRALPPDLTPALEHLAVDPEPSLALVVEAWDCASTGVRLPQRPWSGDDHVARGDVRGFGDARFGVAFIPGINVLNLFDRQRGVAIYCAQDAARMPSDYHGSPLLLILAWFVQSLGVQCVHAAAVGTAHGGALLVGKGGSGKSTAALSCLDTGLRFAGDDYCLLSAAEPPEVRSLFCSAKLEAEQILQFPHLVPLVSNPHRRAGEKAVVFLHPQYRSALAAGFPLRAVLVPHVTGAADTRLRRASPVEALRALAPSTLFQLAGSGASAFANMAAIVRRTPSYHLDVGTDLAQIPRTIQALLEGA